MRRRPARRMRDNPRSRLGTCAPGPGDSRPTRRRNRRRRTDCGTCRHECRGCTAQTRCRERTRAAGTGRRRAACRCGCATARPAHRWSASRTPAIVGRRAPSERCAPRIARAPPRPAGCASPARRRPCRAVPGSADRPAWRVSASGRSLLRCARHRRRAGRQKAVEHLPRALVEPRVVLAVENANTVDEDAVHADGSRSVRAPPPGRSLTRRDAEMPTVAGSNSNRSAWAPTAIWPRSGMP